MCILLLEITVVNYFLELLENFYWWSDELSIENKKTVEKWKNTE